MGVFETPTSGSDSGCDPTKMELIHFGNEFPSEDLQDLFRRIHAHSKQVNHPTLAIFIEKASTTIREEVRLLPAELRRCIPAFDSLLSWAEHDDLRGGPLCGAVDGVLLIVAQLSAYIGYLERAPHRFTISADRGLTALGVGLLAAGAVALSSSIADLPAAGADAVRTAFRMGIHVYSKSENIEARDLSTPRPDSWAYVVHNIDPPAAEEELGVINAKNETAETGKIFVSAFSRTSVTISGPPSRLQTVFNKSKLFRDARSISLPVFGGLCHAPHVYNDEDVEAITSASLLTRRTPAVVQLYSTSTGHPYTASNGEDLWASLVSELLTQSIWWDRVVEGVKDGAKDALTTNVALLSFGNSVSLNELSAELNAQVPAISTSSSNLLTWTEEAVESAPRTPAQAKLAIVGMSCRLPGGATTTEEFWKILEQGLDVSRRIPADRFDVDTHYDPTGKDLNKSMTQYGCFIDEPGLFDAPFFNVSPREAQALDPQMRLALVTAFEALERSGYVGERTLSTRTERIGTFYGQAADDYREVNQGQEVGTYYIPGGCRAFGPGRINYFFKFAGPSYSVDTACSSGLAAVEVACQALWNGSVDMAVTGGVNVLTNPDGFTGLCNGHFLTKGHNACKTWDASADGYCRADGVGSLVIKRLEDAEADNDNILGVILSAGTNHSAEAVSITHPHAGHQAYLSRQVLRQAGVNPHDVSYVEMHGTGTQAGDYEEMQGVLDVYAPLQKRRSKNQQLYVGSVKANVGHGESVAGTTALIKVLMMLEKNSIPPHIGIKTEINPRFPKDFDKRNLHIAMEQTPWPRLPGKKRLAAVNNFGAAGGNTMMILEEAPTRDVRQADPRPTHVVAVSAKTRSALTAAIENLLAYTKTHDTVNIADLAYTTTARKYHFSYRLAVTASDATTLQNQLTSQLQKVTSMKPVGKGCPSVAFAFTGQGASFKSMNLELYHEAPIFRKHIQQLDSLARRQGFPSFISALDGSHPKDHSHSPVITQLALVCTEIALAKYWMSLNVKPDIVVGHSLGEYAALHIAGVITASDTIAMVGRRAQMLQTKCTVGSHTMMAVRAPLSQIQEIAKSEPYTIACINGPSDTVLSGTQAEMDRVATVLGAAGQQCIKLDVAYAFHSGQMDPILESFEAVCKTGVVFHEPRLPVISPLLGKVVFGGKNLNASYMRRATREAVDFVSALENAKAVSAVSDATLWIEIGPHPVCTGFIKSNFASSQPCAVGSFRRGESNWSTLASSMATIHRAGVAISWDDFHRPFESQLQLLDLPTYPFEDKTHWLQYNGDWCLTKGNSFYTTTSANNSLAPTAPKSELQTSTVQQILELQLDGAAGRVYTQSDLMQPDFLTAAWGHRMNDCGVVTSSIHADIAYTLGGFLYRKFFPKAKDVNLNVTDLVVVKGLIAQKDTKVPQYIRVGIETADINSGVMNLTWQNVNSEGQPDAEPFATARVLIEDSATWLSAWKPVAHLVHSRIEALEQMAARGTASRLSRNMAYALWASTLVDYADKYRGMQSVVVHEFEGFCDVQLTTKESGTFTIPPYFIDSVCHLAGFIMNCTDAMDTKNNYCVTPGWRSMRFAEPLVGGARYRSYVKMIPTAEDPTVYRGDVYVMREDGTIIGLVGGIEFRKYPRMLLNHFFSAPAPSSTVKKSASAPAPKPLPAQKAPQAPQAPQATASQQAKALPAPIPAVTPLASTAPTVTDPPVVDSAQTAVQEAPAPAATDSTSAKALALIANEAALEIEDLTDDAEFSTLGVDSLMSLVISEKLRIELDVKVSGSLFLDYPTIGDLRKWLDEYH